jgi:hypothetical protein
VGRTTRLRLRSRGKPAFLEELLQEGVITLYLLPPRFIILNQKGPPESPKKGPPAVGSEPELIPLCYFVIDDNTQSNNAYWAQGGNGLYYFDAATMRQYDYNGEETAQKRGANTRPYPWIPIIGGEFIR